MQDRYLKCVPGARVHGVPLTSASVTVQEIKKDETILLKLCMQAPHRGTYMSRANCKKRVFQGNSGPNERKKPIRTL